MGRFVQGGVPLVSPNFTPGTNFAPGTNPSTPGENPSPNGREYNGNAGVGLGLDLGPLVGRERGFGTRERVPFSGGLSGVEFVGTPPAEEDEGESEGGEGSGDTTEGEEGVEVVHRKEEERNGLDVMMRVVAELNSKANAKKAKAKGKGKGGKREGKAPELPMLVVTSPSPAKGRRDRKGKERAFDIEGQEGEGLLSVRKRECFVLSCDFGLLIACGGDRTWGSEEEKSM